MNPTPNTIIYETWKYHNPEEYNKVFNQYYKEGVLHSRSGIKCPYKPERHKSFLDYLANSLRIYAWHKGKDDYLQSRYAIDTIARCAGIQFELVIKD